MRSFYSAGGSTKLPFYNKKPAGTLTKEPVLDKPIPVTLQAKLETSLLQAPANNEDLRAVRDEDEA